MADEIICPKCHAQNPKDTVFCGKCGTKIPQSTDARKAVDPLIGSFIGDRFLVHEKLGEGGMGVVYRAEQTAIRREVALKVLHADLKDESLFARFQNEAAAASRLNHPNTITIYDFGKAGASSLYIAMEFVKGTSLDEELQRMGAMSVERACQLAVQICGSLQDAHEHNIVHRDLKPENVMLCERAGEKDVVKVLDFGIAKIVEDDGRDQRKALTKTGMVFGTPQYMSPEQIRGEPVDHRSDIYSLGVMLYQMLTGTLPFTAETPMGLLTKHLTEAPKPLAGRGVPAAVADIVLAALEKDATKRPESMRALGGMLVAASGITAGLPTRTAAASPSAKTEPQAIPRQGSAAAAPTISATVAEAGRRRSPLAIGAALLVLLGAGIAGAWFLIQRPAQPGGSAAPAQTVTAPTLTPPPQPTALSQLTQPPPAAAQLPVLAPTPPPPAAAEPVASPDVSEEKDTPSAAPKKGSTTAKKGAGSDQQKGPASKVPNIPIPKDVVDKLPKPDGTSAAPDKDADCTFNAAQATDAVTNGILAGLKKRKKAIRACADQTSQILAMLQYSVQKGDNKPTRIRALRAGNDCVQKQLEQVIISDPAVEPSRGVAVFTLKKSNGTMEKCSVVIRSSKDVVKGRIR